MPNTLLEAPRSQHVLREGSYWSWLAPEGVARDGRCLLDVSFHFRLIVFLSEAALSVQLVWSTRMAASADWLTDLASHPPEGPGDGMQRPFSLVADRTAALASKIARPSQDDMNLGCVLRVFATLHRAYCFQDVACFGSFETHASVTTTLPPSPLPSSRHRWLATLQVDPDDARQQLAKVEQQDLGGGAGPSSSGQMLSLSAWLQEKKSQALLDGITGSASTVSRARALRTLDQALTCTLFLHFRLALGLPPSHEDSAPFRGWRDHRHPHAGAGG